MTFKIWIYLKLYICVLVIIQWSACFAFFIGNFCCRFYLAKIRNFFPVLRKVFYMMFRCDKISEWTWRRDGRPASAFWALTIVRNWKDASAARALTIVRNSEVWRKEAQTLKWLSGRGRICIYSTGFIICNFVNFFCWVINEELLFLLLLLIGVMIRVEELKKFFKARPIPEHKKGWSQNLISQ